MSNAGEIIIRIKALFTGKGAEQAQAAMEATKRKASEMGSSTQQSAQQGGAALNLMGAAGAAMSGSFDGLARASVELLGKIKSLNLSLLQLSLVAAALTALVKVFQMFRDSAQAAADKLSQLKFDIFAQQVKRSADEFDRLTAAMNRQAATADAQLAYNAALIDAHKRESLALNELAKQRELAAEGDESRKAGIEQKYARSAQAITAGFEDKKTADERKRLEAMTEEISARIDELEKRKVELTGKAETAQDQAALEEHRARQRTGAVNTITSLGFADPEPYKKRAAEAKKAAEELTAEADKADAAVLELQTKLRDVMRQINLTDVGKQATGAERAAASATVDTQAADAARKREEEQTRAREEADKKKFEVYDASAAATEANQKFNDATAQGAVVEAGVSSAQDTLMKAREVYNADAADGSVSEQSAQQLNAAKQKMDEAIAAQKIYHESVGRFLDQMKRASDQAAEKVNNMRDTI